MGKGDKKTAKGKITMGSFGKTRPHKIKKAAVAVPVKEKAEPAKEKAEHAKEKTEPVKATKEKA